MKCKICSMKNKFIFTGKILNKYDIKYYHCPNCGFLQTEEPFWLEESYTESINISDTGIMSRNITLSKISSILIYLFFDKNKKFLDFAGGYGLFTRMMRDIGFDFYWNDKYSKNLVTRGFEYQKDDDIEVLTSFESFEHFDNPSLEIEAMFKISKNILFSTDLVSDKPPFPDEWWYYGLEHGQHVSFYSIKTLEFLSKKHKVNLYTNGVNIHLFTEKKLRLNIVLFKTILRMRKIGLYNLIVMLMKSKTVQDMETIIARMNK